MKFFKLGFCFAITILAGCSTVSKHTFTSATERHPASGAGDVTSYELTYDGVKAQDQLDLSGEVDRTDTQTVLTGQTCHRQGPTTCQSTATCNGGPIVDSCTNGTIGVSVKCLPSDISFPCTTVNVTHVKVGDEKASVVVHWSNLSSVSALNDKFHVLFNDASTGVVFIPDQTDPRVSYYVADLTHYTTAPEADPRQTTHGVTGDIYIKVVDSAKLVSAVSAAPANLTLNSSGLQFNLPAFTDSKGLSVRVDLIHSHFIGGAKLLDNDTLAAGQVSLNPNGSGTQAIVSWDTLRQLSIANGRISADKIGKETSGGNYLVGVHVSVNPSYFGGLQGAEPYYLLDGTLKLPTSSDANSVKIKF